MPQLRQIHAQFALIIETKLGLGGAELDYGCEFSISHPVLFVMNAELQPFADGQLAMLPSVNLHALPSGGSHFELSTIARAEGQ